MSNKENAPKQSAVSNSELIRRYAAPDWMVLEPLQRVGQIQQNDMLILNTVRGVMIAKAMLRTNSYDGEEEIVIDAKNNKFFNTVMALAGTSWAKNVLILKAA